MPRKQIDRQTAARVPEAEQPYPVPDNWAWVTLGTVLKLGYGKSLTDKIRSGKGYPVYGANGVVGYHEKTLINSPAIIMGRKGSIGAI